MDKGIDLSGLEKTLMEYGNERLRQTAGKIRDTLYEEGKLAIEEFYNSYNPVFYRRHYYNFYNKSFKKYYSNAHGTVYRGGIELTPQNMDSIYQDPVEEVFDTVYAGLHGPAGAITTGYASIGGIPRNFSPVHRTNSPMERLLKKRDEIIDNLGDYL